ncbi:MFS general substrate transporter [Dendrothele bispora CBS 962.96]|uniref:MFS general substrate transporter n=1 Tax=Dendrothele bispora (strain CBS 962.96) TaxID=1314807 RepID=A0A4S8LES3_DENBC|nr:MFS general substrate transporter [Dendrothele bispora CBS 962.96]
MQTTPGSAEESPARVQGIAQEPIPTSTKTSTQREATSAEYDTERPEKMTCTVPSDFPDGGLRAWLVVFGAMCNTFSTFGYVNSWGTFQAYYQQANLRTTSASDIAWIGSIQFSLIFLPGLVVGRLFDVGYFRVVFTTSAILIVVATFLVPECKEYWQFVLCQGMAIGLGCGGIYSSNTAVIAHWFKRRRGLALGIITVGASIGGIFFPIVIRSLIQRVGFTWCMRTLGFILMFTLGLANVTVRRRLPPSGGDFRDIFNFRLFASASYSIYCLSGFVAFLGMYTVLTFINSSAVFYGVPPGFAVYLTSIANGTSGVARYLCGSLSDRLGSMNVMIPFTLVAAVMTFAWPFARSEGSLIVIAIIYGFASGAYISLIVNPILAMPGSVNEAGRRIGLAMTVLGLGALVGPPISGAINRSTGGFPAVGYYAGSVILISAALMIFTRHLVLKSILGKF